MGRPEGLPKTGGRKKGTPNKQTIELREALHEKGIDLVAELAALLPTLENNKKAEVLLSLMSFVYPKRKAIDVVEVDKENHPQIVFYLPEKDPLPASIKGPS